MSLFGGASSVGCAGESPTIPAEVVRATVMSKHGFYVFAVAASGLLMASGRYVSGALVVENWFSVGVGKNHHQRNNQADCLFHGFLLPIIEIFFRRLFSL